MDRVLRIRQMDRKSAEKWNAQMHQLLYLVMLHAPSTCQVAYQMVKAACKYYKLAILTIRHNNVQLSSDLMDPALLTKQMGQQNVEL